MSAKTSRSVKALILASGKILAKFVTIAIAAVLTRIFLKTEYATYRQTFLAFNLVAPLLTMGIPMALYFFMPKRKEESKAVLIENLIILSFGALLFSLFLCFGGNRLLAWRFSNPEIAQTLFFLIPYAVFELLSRSVTPCLMSHDRTGQVAIYNIVTRLLLFVFAVSAALIYRSTFAVVIAAVLASATRFVIGLYLMWSASANTNAMPKWDGIKGQLKYGIPLGIAGAVSTLSVVLDKFVVASLCDAETFAVYTVGAFELPLASILTGSITAVLLADLSQFHSDGKREEGITVWGRAAFKCSLIVLPAMALMLVFAPYLITILFSEKYAESVVPFRLYLLLIPMRVVNYGSMIMSAGASHLILIRAIIGLILNIGLSIFLTIQIGAIGAAIATIAVAYLFRMPFNLVVISRLWGTPLSKVLPWSKLFGVAAITSCSCSIFLLASIWPSIYSLILFALAPVYAALVIALFMFFGLVERDLPGKIWNKLLRKIRKRRPDLDSNES